MQPIQVIKGVQDRLEVFEDHLTLTPKGLLGFLNKGLKGTKTIPFSSIKAIQLKKAGHVFNGYLQFSILGGNESVGGLFAATKNENTFMFLAAKNAEVEQARLYIEQKLREREGGMRLVRGVSISEEFEKLADLKSRGILTDEEYSSAKQNLLAQTGK